ncbi:TIGR02217 family protein [Falsiroseomonas sp.]|uniref:phage distal tail protein, Rcc01695 family n=1 Tax=Falsiroseomonas sp. TaxID=2870721 RepID=UPI00356AD908
MIPFHEVRFPDSIAYGATGGPVWSTTIAALSTGAEQRNQNWVHARHRWNVATGIKRLADFHQVLRFFQARRGRLHGFRFKDWQDFSSAASPDVPVTAMDQVLGTGPGPHQLAKLYADAGGGWTRTIRKPVAGSVRVSVEGTEQIAPGWLYPWSVDATTGLLSFTGPMLPHPLFTIRAGFEFDVPVRFDTDALAGTYETWRAVAVRDIDLIEIRI